MGRGKRQGRQASQSSQSPQASQASQLRQGALTLSGEARPRQILPDSLVASLKGPKPPQPRKPRATPPTAVDADGNLSEIGYRVLEALADQSDRQKARKDWNGSRVPNGMLEYPEGISESKYKKTLTLLRRAGYVHTKNGMWWVLPEGREQLGQDPSL